ncbi:MAG TPA: hypothetical protein VGL57_12220 [Solirubrobacteraceae bacterium]|jgi:hypothetical protein
MALIVGAATVLGALATVLGVLIAVRGQRRSARESLGVARFKFSYRYAGLSASHLMVRADAAHTPANLTVVDGATHAAWVEYERVRGEMSPEGFGRILAERYRKDQLKTTGKASWSMQIRMRWPARKLRPAVKASVPVWAMGLMSAEDARRYAWEWGAHLCQLIEEGECKQARRDRRVLALTAVFLAVALRARRVLSGVR